MSIGMPTWKNTLEPKRVMTLYWAISLASNLGYTYLKYNGNIYVIINATAAVLTPYTLE